MLLLARLVKLVAAVVVGVIVVGIVLHLLGANASNGVVSAIYDIDRPLVSPFHNLFSLHGRARIVVNWGIAALVYAVVAALVVRLLVAAAATGGGMVAGRRRMV